jgi:hypothetical protein
VGEGGRSDGPCAALGGGRSSGDAEMGGGVRMGAWSFASDNESAWKNLPSEWGLPTEDNGGDGT